MTLAAFVAFAQTDIKVQVHNVVAADEQFNVTFIIEGRARSLTTSGSRGLISSCSGDLSRAVPQVCR